LTEMKIAFSDFWDDKPWPAILDLFEKTQAFELAEQTDADVLVFTDFGLKHCRFIGTKVHYTGECNRPRWDAADFCIGFDFMNDPRYLRFPLFVLNAIEDQQTGLIEGSAPDWADREFCNFIYNQSGTAERGLLYQAISRYRHVASPGEFLNNTDASDLLDRSAPNWRLSKIIYQRKFRFTIAAENRSFPGYTTEKLYDALVAGTIPIYWGNPRVAEDIDPRSFVNCADFANFDEVVEQIRRIDQNPELAKEYLSRRDWLIRPVAFYEEEIADFVARVARFARGRFGTHATVRAVGLSVRALQMRLRWLGAERLKPYPRIHALANRLAGDIGRGNPT
jgi:alpha(1,3/1,4) fucosyltransferase